MHKRLREALSLNRTVKDCGLTNKALDELAELGSEGLADDAADDDIAAKVDLLVPYAKLMQGEITRKTRKSETPKQSGREGEGEDSNDVPQWFRTQMQGFETSLKELQDENKRLKEERARAERNAAIAEKAKQLGIPDYLMKRVRIDDGADIDKELADYKQDLVNNKLMPKETGTEPGTVTEALKAAAKGWAQSLPDAK